MPGGKAKFDFLIYKNVKIVGMRRKISISVSGNAKLNAGTMPAVVRNGLYNINTIVHQSAIDYQG